VPPTPAPPPPSQPAPTDTPAPTVTPVPTQTPLATPTPTPACQIPLANFTAIPNTGKTPLTVQFTDSSVALDCPIIAWDWDFGDGGPHGTTPNQSHQFLFSGNGSSKTFVVTLRVSSAAGTSIPKTVNIVVTKH
jgi:PKD repeat protein